MERNSDIFCAHDENRLLDFLSRATDAIIRARILPPTLDLLNRPDYPYIQADPALKALTAEFLAPFKCDGEDGVEFPSVKAALAKFLADAGEDGNVTFNFRTYASDETANWTCLPEGIAKVFGLYFVREKGHGDGTFLQNVFIYENTPDMPRDEYGQTELDVYAEENENENGGEFYCQFGYTEFDNAEALDKREDVSERIEFTVSLWDVDLSKASIPEGRLDLATRTVDAFEDALAAQVDEDALEYFSGNQILPKAALDA